MTIDTHVTFFVRESVIASPSSLTDTNATLLCDYVIIAYPQSPLDTIPMSLPCPCPIPIMGMNQIQLNRTRSTFTYEYLCNIPVYRCHYDGHDLNSNSIVHWYAPLRAKICVLHIEISLWWSWFKFKSMVYIRLHTKISVQHIGTSTIDDTIDISTWPGTSTHTQVDSNMRIYMWISILSSKL